MRPLKPHFLAMATVSLLALSAASCGSDKDDAAETTAAPAATQTSAPSATTSPETTEASTTASTGGEADYAEYCAAEAAVEQAGSALGDPSEDPKAAATALLPLAQAVHDVAPAELLPVFDKALAAVKSVLETGDPSALETVDLNDAHTFDIDHCGWTTTDVRAQDYKFIGLPDAMVAGTYNFEFTNEGTEPHVFILVAKKAGVTESFDDVLASEDAENKVDTVTAAFAPPGGNGHAIAVLEPGEYVALCPISKGSTMDTEGSGPPHFTLGMQHKITVTG